MIEEKRLKVRVYTKGRLHAKAYIFDYGRCSMPHGKAVERHEKGIAIVGSSNLTLVGRDPQHRTERHRPGQRQPCGTGPLVRRTLE